MSREIAATGEHETRAAVRSPREARRLVVDALSDNCWQAVETAELLVSELVTNARTHAGEETVDVRVVVGNGRATLVVSDHDRGRPELLQVDPTDIGGRGLLLVERLAHQWGIDPSGDGKDVWVQLDCTGH